MSYPTHVATLPPHGCPHFSHFSHFPPRGWDSVPTPAERMIVALTQFKSVALKVWQPGPEGARPEGMGKYGPM